MKATSSTAERNRRLARLLDGVVPSFAGERQHRPKDEIDQIAQRHQG
jgi:hypothetical protein